MSQTFSVPKTSFVGGEWTPYLYGRSDLAKYQTALREMKNVFAHPYGGCSNRSGFRFIEEALNSDSKTRLIPFQFSVEQAYVVEFSDQKIRFLTNGGIIISGPPDFLNIVDNAGTDYKWTESSYSNKSAGLKIWYMEDSAGGDPKIQKPTEILQVISNRPNTALSFLDISQGSTFVANAWSWGDEDSLGYNTVYLSFPDTQDPNTSNDTTDEKIAAFTGCFAYNAQGSNMGSSGSGTNEFYFPSSQGFHPFEKPVTVFSKGVALTEGTLGSLNLNEWAWGDNDSLGYDTVYIRAEQYNNTSEAVVSNHFSAMQIAFADSQGVSLDSPYLEDDINELKFNQSADVLYITHPDYAPRKLLRYGSDRWTLEGIEIGSKAGIPKNLSMGGTTNNYTVTAVFPDGRESLPATPVSGAQGNTLNWDDVPGVDYYNVYKDRNKAGTFGFIGIATNSTFFEASGGITPDFNVTPPISKDPFTDSKYPAVSTFFEQRLVFFRTGEKPQTFWGSVTGDFQNFNISYPLKSDDSYEFTLNSTQVNEIKWAVPLQDLVIGTSGSEWRMDPGVTPTNVKVTVQSKWGVDDIQPVVIGQTILFVDRSKKVLRDLLFSFETDGYAGNDLSVFSEHFFTDYQIVDMAYQADPDSIVWCVRNDGKLLGMTYFKEQKIWGWHIHETDGDFESIATIPTPDGSTDLYAVIRRKINGSFKRYIEILSKRLPVGANFTKDVRDAFFVDSGLSLDIPISIGSITNTNPVVVTSNNHGLVDGDFIDIDDCLGLTELNTNRYIVRNPTSNTFELEDGEGNAIDSTSFGSYVSGGVFRKTVNTIFGLQHLEGKEVSVLADGSYVKGLVVSGGSITLENRASRVHVGLPYESRLETLDFEISGSDVATIQDRERNVPSVLVSLQDTRALQIGPPDDDRLTNVVFRTDEAYDKPTRLFNGDKDIDIDDQVDTNSARVRIRNTTPLPFSIRKIIARVEFGDN